MGTGSQNGIEGQRHCQPGSRMTNAPEDLDKQVNGLVVGAWGGGVRLDADAVRSGGLCHGHSLLSLHGLFFLPTLLLCVRTLILWRRGLHQAYILTVFFHPREDTVLVSHVSQAPRTGYHLLLRGQLCQPNLSEGVLPAVSWCCVCGYVVKLHLPPHHMLAHLHSCDTACVPLPVHTHLHVQPFI